MSKIKELYLEVIEENFENVVDTLDELVYNGWSEEDPLEEAEYNENS